MKEQQLLNLVAEELLLSGNRPVYKAKPEHYYVAFSGGVDSTALLSLMCQLRDKYDITLTALHVDHQLNENSGDWAEHCQRVCHELDVPLKVHKATLISSSEESARDARYQWFGEIVQGNSVLLTAHHRQDRVETLLFNLMRGAGSTGLSSMRSKRVFNDSVLHRPLVHTPREDLVDYINAKKISWIEDPSNQDNDYSRNHIRNVIVPALNNFREDAVQNIARSAWNLEQENTLLKEVAISDLVEVREYPKHPIDQSYALCFEDVQHLSLNRQSNLVRFWLRSLNLHVPSQRLLVQLLEAFINPPKSTSILQESGVQFRFYKGFMYVMPVLNDAAFNAPVHWSNIQKPLDLYDKRIRIDSTNKLRELCDLNQQSDIRLASRSDVNNPKALQGHSLNLKKWLQDIGVPPWRRTTFPILTMVSSDSDIVLGPVDQQMQSDWVLLECPVA